MLTQLLRWWWARMTELVPPRLRPAASGPASAVVLTLRSEGVDPVVILSTRRHRRETERLRFPLADAGLRSRQLRLSRRGAPVVLRPPSSWLLEREVGLPLAAEEELRRVLAYEMDRFTPFSADDVYWGFHVLDRDLRAGVIRLRLSVVPRAGLRALTEALAAVAMAPALLEIPAANGGIRVLPIERPQTGREQRRRALLTAGALGCVVLAIAAVAQPLIRQSLRAGAIDDRIAALQPAVTRVEGLRRRLAAASDGADAIAGERARLADPLLILATVTRSLPDDTYLTSFGLHERTITMAGQSASAAKIITALTADKLIEGPAFTAPVTRTEHGADLFAIRARAAGG